MGEIRPRLGMAGAGGDRGDFGNASAAGDNGDGEKSSCELLGVTDCGVSGWESVGGELDGARF